MHTSAPAGVNSGFSQSARSPLDDPEALEVVECRLMEQYSVQYLRAFERLGVQGMRRGNVCRLLAKRKILALEATDGSISDSQTTGQELISQLTAILGKEGVALLDEYDRTTAARKATLRLERRLALTDFPLTTEQSAKIIEILFRSRKSKQVDDVKDRIEEVLNAEQKREYEKFLSDQIKTKRVEARYGGLLDSYSLVPRDGL